MRHSRACTALFLLIAALSAQQGAGRRLLFYPLGERTHMLVHLALAGELASRGHEVHFMTPACHQAFAESVLARSHPGALLHFVPYPLDCEFVEKDKQRAAVAGPVHGIWMILEALAQRTDAILSDAGYMGKLRALAATTDLLIADPLAYGPLMAFALDIPHVDLDVGTAGALFEPFWYGAALAPSYVPALSTFLPTNGMNAAQKVINLVAHMAGRALLQLVYYHPGLWVQAMVRKHGLYAANAPYTKPLLHLVNSNWVTEPPRPVAPLTKYIGPLLPAPAAPLTPDWATWLDGSGPRGAVLVSFGGTLAAPPTATRAVLAAMAALPDVRFVWKLGAGEVEALGGAEALAAAAPNVRAAGWVPQNDLLGHPQLRAFVTQGGYLSIAEAAYHGVPIVGVPLIAGQGELIRFAADCGRGKLLDKRSLLAGDWRPLAAALSEVLDNRRFHAEAAKAAARIRAAPTPYKQQAAEWVEYAADVADHGPFLHTQGMAMAWWEVAMLDSAALVAAALALPVIALLTLRSRRRQQQQFDGQSAAEQQGDVGKQQQRPAPQQRLLQRRGAAGAARKGVLVGAGPVTAQIVLSPRKDEGTVLPPVEAKKVQ